MNLPERARLALSQAADFLFPPHCAFCGALLPGERTPLGYCAACESGLPWVLAPWCLRCGIPFHAFDGGKVPHKVSQEGGHACGKCTLDPPPFERARSAVHYKDQVRSAILRFKYGRDFSVLKSLEHLLARGFESLREGAPPPEALCPVPLHPSRVRERHFDQARILCARLSARIGIPAQLGALRRARKTDFQASLSKEERARNVRGAFEAAKGAKVRGKRVLLVDDVFTTGATARECARVLLDQAGAKSVDVLCIAMAVPE